MGWFEEQVKKRQKLDEKTFENSFMSLAGLHVNNQNNLSEEALKENYAIQQILSYFHYQMADVSNTITVFKDKINYALRTYEILYNKIELNENWIADNNSPLLVFTKVNRTPVVLLPKGTKSYYYINYQTGKKIKVNNDILEKVEIEAYSFYRPLPTTKTSIKEYINYIRKSVRIIDIVLLVLFAALASGVGLLLPFLTKLLTGQVTNDAMINHNYGQFIAVSIYVVATATGLLLIKATQAFANSRVTLKIEKSVQEATMMRVLSLPTSFFKKYNTGELTSRFYSVPVLANTIINGVFMTLVSVVMSLAYLFQIIGFAASLVFPVIIILVITAAFNILVSLVQKNFTQKTLELGSKEAGVTYEIINGIQKIRLSGSEKRVFAKWAAAYSKTAKLKYHPPLIIRLSPAITLLISLLGNIVIYYIAARNNIDVGNYMAFVTGYGVLSSAFASLSRVVGLISTIKPIYEMARPILEAQPENNQGKLALESIRGDIKLKNVSFKYLENGPYILNKLSLDIKEGEYIAIVGQTGCGKSTLVRLLLGFEKPASGNIFYDGININEIDLTSLRRNIGTVMQNGTLFHADIFSNIIISSPNLKEEDAWRAAEIADIAKDIKEMPMGMHTVISEGQGGISGGQKQRIMIARAIVHKPKILIFDEATSALDNKTQRSISESINKLNCTRIVIAHRLSTIKSADRIIMLEGGQIIEEGSYQQLIDKKGKFAELVDRQRLDK